jgi:hypothetical protein
MSGKSGSSAKTDPALAINVPSRPRTRKQKSARGKMGRTGDQASVLRTIAFWYLPFSSDDHLLHILFKQKSLFYIVSTRDSIFAKNLKFLT